MPSTEFSTGFVDNPTRAPGMTGPVLAVAIDAPLRRLFDYRPPPGVAVEKLQPGQRVWVPFGRRKAVGVILELRERSALPDERLKSALALIDDEPVLDATLLDLLRWSAEYYRHPPGEVVAAALPVALRDGADATATAERWTLSAAARTGSAEPLGNRATRLRDMAGYLETHGPAGAAELGALSNRWRDHLRELERRGWVIRVREEVSLPPLARPAAAAVAELQLTPEQGTAVTTIVAALGRHAPFVLHGVTGSGKTEVYLRAIAEVVARGEQALVLVPEISLTPQLVERFAARFPGPLAVLHSGLDRQRPAAGLARGPRRHGTDRDRHTLGRVRAAGAAGAVRRRRGARPVLQATGRLPLLGPRPGARACAAARHPGRARLGDAVAGEPRSASAPVARSCSTCRTGPRVRGRRRLRLVDLRAHAETQGMATPTVLAIRRHLDAGGQVLVYLNRRGYAPTLFCPGCGWVAPCPRCDARLTVHLRERSLDCHHCGTHRPVPEACPDCGAEVKPVGQGTERIEEALGTLFPDAALARIDRDAMRKRGSLEATLERVHSGEVRLLVGTQMLTKGHHFPQVTLVVVLNADQGLFGTDFRAAERLAQTIVQVSGRAGRAERPGEVLIQTEYPGHPLLQQLVSGGYDAFAAAALVERQAARWPPFARVAVLRAEAPGREAPLAFLERAREWAEACAEPGVELLGPATAPMERRAGHHRAQLLLHAATHSPLQRLLARWVPLLEEATEARRVRWALDVDPLELF